MVVQSNKQIYVVESSSRKRSDFKRNRKFFKKNNIFDGASKKGKIGACKKC